jgi:hypothetical protein
VSAHEYCPGHEADGSDAPSGDASDLRVIECPRCTPRTEGGVTLIAALGGDTTVNTNPPEGMWIEACAPTDDPDYWQMIQECGSDCHHPVHAFHPERRRHLIAASDATYFRHEPLRAPGTR